MSEIVGQNIARKNMSVQSKKNKKKKNRRLTYTDQII